MATTQLTLIDTGRQTSRLDRQTIRVGRRGLEAARVALAQSSRPYAEDLSERTAA